MTDTGCANKNIRSLGRRILTLVLCLSLVLSAIPGLATAQSLGASPSSVYASAIRYLAQVASSGASFFTGDRAGEGTVVTAVAGSVWMLVSNDFYTIDGVEYYCVYYNNEIYHVRRTEMVILSDADVQTYIRNTMWKSGNYATLKQTLELVGDVRVYALQMALQSLGYYTGLLDGNYGKDTDDAVYKFQRANGLSRDGDAGPLTQAALYAKASGTTVTTGGTVSGGTISGGTTTTTTSGTLRTRVSVNLRESASSASPKLASVPVNSVLTFFNTRVSGGVTWYQVVYGNQNGWLMGTYVTVTSSSSGGSAAGTLVTTDKVNLRKNASQSSARLGVVPQGITMAYSDTSTSGNVTWYKVTYGLSTGWLMGNYVRASGTISGGGSSGNVNTNTGVVTGTVRITKASTRVRATPNGSKTGVVLAIGTMVNMTGTATTAAGYTWYPIVTTSGVSGYVRGDCATVVSSGGSIGGGGTGTITTTPTTSKRFVTLPMTTSLFTTSTRPSSGAVNVPQGSVLQMVTPETYTGSDGAIYCRLYYNGTAYNALYSDVSGGIMSDSVLAAYVVQLWNSALNDKFYNNGSLVGDVRVYAMQLALNVLGYYTGELDGSYGDSSEAAVKSFQRSQSGLDADGVMGVQTWPVLGARARAVSNGSATYTGITSGGSSGGSGGGSGSTTVADFGTIAQVTKPTWTEADNGNFWPKSSFATVLDVTTGKVFTIYRTGGNNHPDAVPYTTTDTQTMCEIVGFSYPNRHPTADHLRLIVADSNNNNATYTWPDFKGTLTGVASIGSAWDRRPALLNVNGQVYAVSIYGWPHGFMGIGASDGLSTQKFPNGNLLYENNNFYGCLCVRFYNSTGHGSTVNQAVINQHNAAADTAYAYAQRNWPSLCR